jgi:hypothetical protein
MNDLGRRYALLIGSSDGRRILATGLLGVGIVLDVIAYVSGARGNPHAASVLFSAATGVMGVAIIFLLTTRRAR